MTDAALQGGCRWCGKVIDPNMQAHAIVQEVATEHRIPIEDIYSRNRRGYIGAARTCAMWRIWHEAGLRERDIAELFGVHRTTVIHHLNGNGAGAREQSSGERQS